MNKESIKEFEILAPSGNRGSFFAAINSGADAIYIGLKEFNARNNIENFAVEELSEIVDYAHMFDVKVYVAFNILIKDEEMENALNIVKKAYLSGVDAFIVQDIGLASLMKEFFPDIVLHASTQMGIHNLEGAKFLESQGFKRVVLSRETPLDEIKRIHDETNLEIEYFIQGALCVAFSGNCYLCSLLTGNSGNRGKCQQFCRLPYTMEINKQKRSGYFLSAKDFCMLPMLKELADAGVKSFKIEGRARREAYVAGVVEIYKRAVENDFKFSEKDIEDLKKLFNRGDYTPGYFNDNKIIYPNVQGHIGIKIGKVVGFRKGNRFNVVEIVSDKKISKGDGLKFIKNNIEVGSIGVNDIKEEKDKYIITTTAQIEIGADVHLTLDSENEAKILSKIRKLGIKAKFEGIVGKTPKLTFAYKDIDVTICGNEFCREAVNQPVSKEDIVNQISKLNETPFELKKIDIETDNIFMAKSVLNDLRRRTVLELKEKIIEKNKTNRKHIEIKLNRKNNNLLNNKFDKKIYLIHELKDLNKINDKINKIIYSPYNYEIKLIKQFVEYCENRNINPFLDLPIYANKNDILFIKNILDNLNINIVANNYYALNLTNKNKIILGMGLNIYNNYSCDFYENLGFCEMILSKELAPLELENFKGEQNVFAFAKGKHEYMDLKHCPFKEHVGGSCKDCKFVDGLSYTMQSGKKFLIKRKKLTSCQFILKSFESIDLSDKIGINQLVEVD